MKVIIILALVLAIVSCATVTVTTVGDTFDPAIVSANVGDIVSFQGLGLTHNVVQVADENSVVSNGFVSGLPGELESFDLTITSEQSGTTIYYVCVPHVATGMRGQIVVATETLAPTAAPSTISPSTASPSTVPPSTFEPSIVPSSVAPSTLAPSTVPTVAPSTLAPSTLAPSTELPTTAPPSTVAPSSVAPSTIAPTTVPSTAPISVQPSVTPSTTNTAIPNTTARPPARSNTATSSLKIMTAVVATTAFVFLL